MTSRRKQESNVINAFFLSVVVLTDCSKLLSTQGPTFYPRVHFSSIPNPKGLSSIHLATIATRPLPSVIQQPHSFQPAAVKPELRYRTIARYVLRTVHLYQCRFEGHILVENESHAHVVLLTEFEFIIYVCVEYS